MVPAVLKALMTDPLPVPGGAQGEEEPPPHPDDGMTTDNQRSRGVSR